MSINFPFKIIRLLKNMWFNIKIENYLAYNNNLGILSLETQPFSKIIKGGDYSTTITNREI